MNPKFRINCRDVTFTIWQANINNTQTQSSGKTRLPPHVCGASVALSTLTIPEFRLLFKVMMVGKCPVYKLDLLDRRYIVCVTIATQQCNTYGLHIAITHMRVCKPLCKSAQIWDINVQHTHSRSTKQTVCDCVLYALRIADVNWKQL